jgi:hypothetical protein
MSTAGIPDGATWFLRCAECETLWVASSGFDWRTGQEACYWVRPRPIRSPKPCRHQGGIERWAGTRWEATPIAGKHEEEQDG